MHPICRFVAILFSLLCAVPVSGQKQQREPLTDAQIEQIRDTGIDPVGRVSLYTRILDEHAAVIKGLTNRANSNARSLRLDSELQDLTALIDDLESNLDDDTDRHADIRSALKPLAAAAPHWVGIVRALAGEPAFDISRKMAIESGEDLADQAARLLREQTEYFNLHKDERGQQRAEPK